MKLKIKTFFLSKRNIKLYKYYENIGVFITSITILILSIANVISVNTLIISILLAWLLFGICSFLNLKIRNNKDLVKIDHPLYKQMHELETILTTFNKKTKNTIYNDIFPILEENLKDEEAAWIIQDMFNQYEQIEFISKLKQLNENDGLIQAFMDKSYAEQKDMLHPILKYKTTFNRIQSSEAYKHKLLLRLNYIPEKMLIEMKKKSTDEANSKKLDELMNNKLINK